MDKYSTHGVPKQQIEASAPAGHSVHKTHEAAYDGHSAKGHGKRLMYATGKHPFHSGTGPGRGH